MNETNSWSVSLLGLAGLLKPFYFNSALLKREKSMTKFLNVSFQIYARLRLGPGLLLSVN
jgi:hypothetical protein